MLRKMFEVLNENQWKSELVIKFNRIVSQTILCKEKNEKALGFAIFVVEIFSEELAKVTLIHKLFATLLLKHFLHSVIAITRKEIMTSSVQLLFFHTKR